MFGGKCFYGIWLKSCFTGWHFTGVCMGAAGVAPACVLEPFQTGAVLSGCCCDMQLSRLSE